MIGSQTTSTIAEDSVASGTGGGGGAGGRIFVISDKNFRSSSFDQGRTGGTATTGNCSFKYYFIWRMNRGKLDFLASEPCSAEEVKNTLKYTNMRKYWCNAVKCYIIFSRYSWKKKKHQNFALRTTIRLVM